MENKNIKFRGYIENEWLDMRANLKCFQPILNYELKKFPSWIVLYVWLGDKNLYPETHIKYSMN